MDTFSSTPSLTTTEPESEINLIQSSSLFNINFDRNGEFIPNTSNVLAMAIASWKEWTMLPELEVAAADDDDDVDALSFERSELNVGVTAPNERDRARRSREGEEEADDDDEATTAAMVGGEREQRINRCVCVVVPNF